MQLPTTVAPRLVIIVDAEEEFEWGCFSAGNRNVTTMAAQTVAHRIFERYRIVPTYVVDYPVASQEDGYRPLLDFLRSGVCDIGAQLHSWVTPPHEEEISERNSFTNNLPVDLQRRKLEVLTREIERNFGVAPKVYRAGRFGAGEATPTLLREFGYEVDCSVLPGTSEVNFAPDYKGVTCRPYWLTFSPRILELPVTIGEVGIARRYGDSLRAALSSPIGKSLRFSGIAARLRLLERIRLTPEGSTLEECKRLTRTMLGDGHRVFAMSYHSPSLVPGHTPYVRNEADLRRFMGCLEGYLEFFFADIGGEASTPLAIRDWAVQMCDTVKGP